jgi:centriolar protein POC1
MKKPVSIGAKSSSQGAPNGTG